MKSMGRKTIFQVFAVLACVFMNQGALAGNEGAGGDGARIGDAIYLLDLLEYGVEENPHVDETVRSHRSFETIKASLKTELQNFGSETFYDIVTYKLLEAARMDYAVGYQIYAAIKLLGWRLVNHDLVNIPDEDSLLEYGNLDLIQVAIRRDKTVRISRESWALMNDKHKAATIFHEAVYTLMQPECDTCAQDSSAAREIVGMLFSTDIADSERFRSVLSGRLGLTHGQDTNSGRFVLGVDTATFNYSPAIHGRMMQGDLWITDRYRVKEGRLSAGESERAICEHLFKAYIDSGEVVYFSSASLRNSSVALKLSFASAAGQFGKFYYLKLKNEFDDADFVGRVEGVSRAACQSTVVSLFGRHELLTGPSHLFEGAR